MKMDDDKRKRVVLQNDENTVAPSPFTLFRFFRLYFRLEFGHHRRGVVVVRDSFGEMERDQGVRESGKASESARGTRSIIVKRRRRKGEDDDDF